MAKLTKPKTDKVLHKQESLESSLDKFLPRKRNSSSYDTLQLAIDDTPAGGTLNIDRGTYVAPLVVGNLNIVGDGAATLIRQKEGFSKAVRLKTSIPHWAFHHSGSFSIDGTGTVGATGIGFDENEQYAGRHNVSDVYLHNLNKAIEKPAGNIGNTWRHISIDACQWGYYAKSASEMHCGADTLYNVHMSNIDTYAIYLNATVGADSNFGGGIGGWWLKDSIIEGAKGGGIYLKNKKGDTPQAPCGISNVWFEAVAKEGAVNVDGAAIKPRTLHLIDTSIFYAEYSYINNIKLENSNLVTYGCRFDNADLNQDFDIDSNSTVKAYDAYLNGSSGGDVIVESIASQLAQLETASVSMRGSLPRSRMYNPSSGRKLKAITFANGTHTWGGNADVQVSSVPDGLLSPTCEKFVFPRASITELTESRVTTTKDKWYVYGISAYLESGYADMEIKGGITFGRVFLKQGQWISTFGVAQASRPDTANLYCTTSEGATVKLADYFVVEFDTQAEALAFANLRVALEE